MAYATQPVGMCLIRRNENCTERAFLLPQIEGISNKDICRVKKPAKTAKTTTTAVTARVTTKLKNK